MSEYQEALIKALNSIGDTDWPGVWIGAIGTALASLVGGGSAYFIAKMQIDKYVKNEIAKEKTMNASKLKVERYEQIYSIVCNIEAFAEEVSSNIKVITVNVSDEKLQRNYKDIYDRYIDKTRNNSNEIEENLSKLKFQKIYYRDLKIDIEKIELYKMDLLVSLMAFSFYFSDDQLYSNEGDNRNLIITKIREELLKFNNAKKNFTDELREIKQEIEGYFDNSVLRGGES